MGLTIIGIDAATDPRKIGLVRGWFDGTHGVVREVRLGAKVPPVSETIAGWIEGPTLLAIDAPLGWPAPLGRVLAGHRAGQPLAADAKEEVFDRLTDRRICERIGKKPLDVGADRIARTARKALELLEEVRRRAGEAIPLVWAPMTAGVGCIEVYPAATLQVRAIESTKYKRGQKDSVDKRRARERILESLAREVDVSAIEREELLRCDDVLDAVVCLLAGLDFVRGRAVGPADEEREVAVQEGWIWVRA